MQFCRKIELGRKSRYYQLSLILSRELDKKKREEMFTNGLERMVGMVRSYYMKSQQIDKLYIAFHPEACFSVDSSDQIPAVHLKIFHFIVALLVLSDV